MKLVPFADAARTLGVSQAELSRLVLERRAPRPSKVIGFAPGAIEIIRKRLEEAKQ